MRERNRAVHIKIKINWILYSPNVRIFLHLSSSFIPSQYSNPTLLCHLSFCIKVYHPRMRTTYIQLLLSLPCLVIHTWQRTTLPKMECLGYKYGENVGGGQHIFPYKGSGLTTWIPGLAAHNRKCLSSLSPMVQLRQCLCFCYSFPLWFWSFFNLFLWVGQSDEENGGGH